ncbi:MAG TPA: hypothetical protein VGK05_03430 [Acidimicrobiia bacterium]
MAGVVGLVASSAFAMHNEPSKAAGLKGVLVTAYNACTSPNDTTTGALPLPACHPAVRSDPNCSFDVKGKGQFSAKVKAPDVLVAAKLQGLAANCEGKTLQLAATVRTTTDGCTSGDANGCTVQENPFTTDFAIPGATCTVTGGKCAIKSSVNSAAAILTGGNHTGLQIFAITILDGSAKAFQSGLLDP